jgi:hypothetical protein
MGDEYNISPSFEQYLVLNYKTPDELNMNNQSTNNSNQQITITSTAATISKKVQKSSNSSFVHQPIDESSTYAIVSGTIPTPKKNINAINSSKLLLFVMYKLHEPIKWTDINDHIVNPSLFIDTNVKETVLQCTRWNSVVASLILLII